ncbi:MAG TPA: hypothetical protein DCE42_27650 [Myxococcales bacterium]|nr:hypothetical protein [Deltaproteobacteria bacterium]MBU51284.1 hypothetical protein [Deltaproteobacteria bacterium]HAA58569.1 hypothetical protein [Myxococcales bacterium]|tara:strand:- start:2547 stop:4181 length:1635 start_codon:yes stop_codon:yes gene_type:complete
MQLTRDEQTDNLKRPPEARNFKVEDLIRRVEDGYIRIPSFQRQLKWEPQDALNLLDSLYRGYPVGTLIFWKTPAKADIFTAGELTIEVPERADALWVVDGQQRLVSLVLSLVKEHKGNKHDFYFDLDEEGLKNISQKQRTDDPTRWLPMTQVLDSEDLLQWLYKKQPSPTRTQKAIRVGKRIREYEIPTYTITTTSEKTVRDVFARINHAGKSLEESEVFDAIHSTTSEESSGSFDDISRNLRPLGFGELPQDTLNKVMSALLGRQKKTKFVSSEQKLTSEKALEAYTNVEEATRRTIGFLKSHAHIPHFDLLPYKQPFVFLAKFFHHHPSPSSRSTDLLSRWLWRLSLTKALRNFTLSEPAYLGSISEDEEASVQSLLQQLPENEEALLDIDAPFRFNHATSKLFTLALFTHKPKNLETEKLILPSSLDTTPSGHLLIPTLVQDKNLQHYNGIANRIFYPKQKQLKKQILQANPALLQTHMIDLDALEALRDGDEETFLELRAKTIEEYSRKFFAKCARWGETDRPSLLSLLADDDDDEDEDD